MNESLILDAVLSRFQNPQRNGKSWKVRCPTHDDRRNSLSISEADNGKILLKCQAGCSTESVIDAVGLTWRDLSGNGKRPQNDPVIARYVYVDEHQRPLFRVCRTRSKGFFQERFEPSSGKFIPGMNGARRVLYRLPDVLADETVFVAEGEKDCDNLAGIGLTATTNPSGAGKWEPAYREFLKDKHVVIFPDNDEPGQNHALTVARSVSPVAKSVKIVTLPDVPAKADVSDYLKTHTKDDLLALVRCQNENYEIRCLFVSFFSQTKNSFFLRASSFLN